MSGISSKIARSISRRGCARVMSHTEMATFCPGVTSDRSGGLSIGARMAASSAPCGSGSACAEHRLDDGDGASGEIDLEAVAAVVETHAHRPRVYHRADAGRRRNQDGTERGSPRNCAAICGASAVLTEPVQLLTYECDALPHLRETPAVVVLPASAAEVQAVVRALRARRRAVRGARPRHRPLGRRAAGARRRRHQPRPAESRARRSTSRTGCVTVEPGVTNLEITRQVAPFGYYYAPDPSSQQVCSIGGNVAENSGGAHCLKYGFTVHHVLEVEAVLPDGEPDAHRQPARRRARSRRARPAGRQRGHAGRRDEGGGADPAPARDGADAARGLRHASAPPARRCPRSSPPASSRPRWR